MLSRYIKYYSTGSRIINNKNIDNNKILVFLKEQNKKIKTRFQEAEKKYSLSESHSSTPFKVYKKK